MLKKLKLLPHQVYQLKQKIMLLLYMILVQVGMNIVLVVKVAYSSITLRVIFYLNVLI